MSRTEKVLIFDASGVPLLFFDFESHEMRVDKVLVTGFLTALQAFSSELFETAAPRIGIELGQNVVTMIRREDLILAVIGHRKYLHLERELTQMLAEIDHLLPRSGLVLEDQAILEPIRRRLIRILFKIPIAQDWIPVPVEESTAFETCQTECSWLSELDGHRRIEDLRVFGEKPREEIYTILNALYVDGAVTFTNFIEDRDYIIGSEQVKCLLGRVSTDRDMLSLSHPDVDIVSVVKDLDEFVLVGVLRERYGGGVVSLLEHLWRLGYVQIADEDTRRLLIAIDVFSIFITILRQLVDESKLMSEVQQLIRSTADHDVLQRLKLLDNEIEIERGFSLLEFESVTDRESAITSWVNITLRLIDIYLPKLKARLVPMVYEYLIGQYLQRFHNEDLSILNPILYRLEQDAR